MKVILPSSVKRRFLSLFDEIENTGVLATGPMIDRFEEKLSEHLGASALALMNGGVALEVIARYFKLGGSDVVVPSNTFIASARAMEMAGARVVYADCSRKDLCLSLENLKSAITPNTRAVVVVHIGGHIAFDIEKIADYCREKGIVLIEDCAHAHGAMYKGKRAGTFGDAGAYSFYATKTMPMGEGGAVVSKNRDFIEWLKRYRNYGKDERAIIVQEGFNYRMNEITAAFGIALIESLEEILKWKYVLAEKYHKIFGDKRLVLPDEMISGYYKYIVFDPDVKLTTGLVYGDLCHDIDHVEVDLPDSRWIAANHRCPPIWYGWEGGGWGYDELREKIYRGE